MARILTIAVHPDDETLGCGGALLKHKTNGDDLYWLIVTRTWAANFSPQAIECQKRQVQAVETAYPFTQTFWLNFPTTQLDCLPLADVIGRIQEVIAQVRPQVVYVPNRSDVHSDHRVVFNAVMAVVKSFYMKSLGVRRILASEVLSETDAAPPLAEGAFLPNVYWDISDTLERKLEILRLFENEIHPEPLPRNLSAIRALARFRGATVGTVYAEAFMLIREIV